MSFLWENLFKKQELAKDLKIILKQNYLFQDLNPAELKLLKNAVHQREYGVGETIFKQGELGVGMYIIVRGTVDIVVEKAIGPGVGPPVVITQLSDGDFLGEMALVDKEDRRTATAVAATNCSLLGFFQPDLQEIMDRKPSMGIKVVYRLGQVLATRLKETTQKVSQLKQELIERHLLEEN